MYGVFFKDSYILLNEDRWPYKTGFVYLHLI
jgi:hypothetical protein